VDLGRNRGGLACDVATAKARAPINWAVQPPPRQAGACRALTRLGPAEGRGLPSSPPRSANPRRVDEGGSERGTGRVGTGGNIELEAPECEVAWYETILGLGSFPMRTSRVAAPDLEAPRHRLLLRLSQTLCRRGEMTHRGSQSC
jgi:hypothetical protein